MQNVHKEKKVGNKVGNKKRAVQIFKSVPGETPNHHGSSSIECDVMVWSKTSVAILYF